MMNTKKTKRADLERHRTTMFLIGMALSLGLVWMAFEYKSTDLDSSLDVSPTSMVTEQEELIPITDNRPEPPKPKIEVLNLKVTDDDVPDLPDFEIDPEIDPDAVIDDPIFDPEPLEKEVKDPILKIYEISQSPEFIGGDDGLRSFLRSNLTYPEMAVELNQQGTVYVGFVVEKDGSISNCQVIRGVGAECDAEALRVVKAMPKWAAGEQMGKKVRVAFTLPVTFTLK